MDTSRPSTIAILSKRLKPEHQGTASSLVNTAVSHSISIGLGIACTIIKHTGGSENITGAGQPGPEGQAGLYPGGDEKLTFMLLRGYHGAWYFGIGLGGFSLIVAGSFAVSEVWKCWLRRTMVIQASTIMNNCSSKRYHGSRRVCPNDKHYLVVRVSRE